MTSRASGTRRWASGLLQAAARWATPREGAVGTRVAAVMALVGSVYLLLNTVITPETLNGARWGMAATAVATLSLSLLAGPALLWPQRMPRWFGSALALACAGTVLALDLITQDTSSGAQIYLGWPVLYAAYHLRRGMAWLVAACCLVAQVSLLLVLAGPQLVQRDTPAWATTMAAITWMLATARDRSATLVRRLKAEAAEDPLTGLASRRAFGTAFGEHLAAGTVQGLILVDVDHFKQINDGHGHVVGDAVLCSVAAALRRACRTEDVVGRIGGDEFAVVLVRSQGWSPALAEAAAERFRAAVGTLSPPGGHGVRVSVSVGLAVTEPGDDAGALTARADAAMYEAKRRGRNTVVAAAAGEGPASGGRPDGR